MNQSCAATGTPFGDFIIYKFCEEFDNTRHVYGPES